MAATVSGAKTVTASVAPHLSAAALTTLMAIAVENLTVAQFMQIHDALRRVSGGTNPGAIIGAILT